MSDLVKMELVANWFWSFVVVLVVVVFWFAVSKAYRRWDKAGDENERKALHRRVARNLHTFLKYALIAVTVLVILQIHGVEVGPMAASLGIVGIVLGFALQTGLEDVIMGVHIVTDGFYRVGDVLIYRGIQGEVISATPQTTKIRNIVDNSVVAISNRNLHEVEVASSLSVVRVPIAYRTDPFEAERVLKSSCEKAPKEINIIATCRYAFIDSYDSFAAVHVIVVESEPVDRIAAQRALRSLVIKDLAAAGITIADETSLLLKSQNGETPPIQLLEKHGA